MRMKMRLLLSMKKQKKNKRKRERQGIFSDASINFNKIQILLSIASSLSHFSLSTFFSHTKLFGCELMVARSRYFHETKMSVMKKKLSVEKNRCRLSHSLCLL